MHSNYLTSAHESRERDIYTKASSMASTYPREFNISLTSDGGLELFVLMTNYKKMETCVYTWLRRE